VIPDGTVIPIVGRRSEQALSVKCEPINACAPTRPTSTRANFHALSASDGLQLQITGIVLHSRPVRRPRTRSGTVYVAAHGPPAIADSGFDIHRPVKQPATN
jgi:hypothetical protein